MHFASPYKYKRIELIKVKRMFRFQIQGSTTLVYKLLIHGFHLSVYNQNCMKKQLNN